MQKYTKTDPLEKILTQLEKQPNAINITNNADIGPHSNNTTHDHTTPYEEEDNDQRKGEENIGQYIGQNISVNKTPVRRSSDNKEDGQDNVIRTRYGRIIKKPDILAADQTTSQPKSAISMHLQHKTDTLSVNFPLNMLTS